MPACYLVDIADAQLYFDRNRSRCRAPGSRPAGQPNTIYFVRTRTPSPLLHFRWNDGLKDFDAAERRSGTEWVKDAAYEYGQLLGSPAEVTKNRNRRRRLG